METPGEISPKSHRHYFVDEAGDGTLFNAKGKVIIGEEGCSKYFMLGILHVPDPDALNQALDDLRKELLRDPYFRKIPSMQPSQNKTTIAFHAKDDIPEVRREVFKLLGRFENLRLFAVIRDKLSVLDEVKQYENKRYNPNELYDQMVKKLFQGRLHQSDEYFITFATRGQSDRTRALREALIDARKLYGEKTGIKKEAHMTVANVPSHEEPCLQAADYVLWAIQRCYERREDRYLETVAPFCHFIHDIDDKREKSYGVYYGLKNPLRLEGLPLSKL
jgi:hypothetical protein